VVRARFSRPPGLRCPLGLAALRGPSPPPSAPSPLGLRFFLRFLSLLFCFLLPCWLDPSPSMPPSSSSDSSPACRGQTRRALSSWQACVACVQLAQQAEPAL
jgi:hypothetical protein